MKRRDFLVGGTATTHEETQMLRKPVPPSLDKFEGTLTRRHAQHLLRRLTFSPTNELIESLVGKTPDQALDILLGNGTEPNPSPGTLSNWLTTAEFNPLGEITEIRFEIEGRLRSRYRDLIDWWLDLMRTNSNPTMEKLTLFLATIWSIEFPYDTEALVPPPLLYKNNQMLRSNRLAKYDKVALDCTLDGAMLLYQSLFYSTSTSPNENYMRELMELFTMGIGNYTEGDIREGSRALTGWRTAAYFAEPAPNGYFETYFSPKDHDTGEKTLFTNRKISARTSDENTEFQVKEQEVGGLIKILFDERATAISRFVCEKIYKYFVYSSPGDVDYEFINELATKFVDNQFSLSAIYRELFTSKYFYNEEFVGCQIKTPAEFLICFESQLGVNLNDKSKAYRRTMMQEMEQELYDPPNVANWSGYRTWMSTKTYQMRVKTAKDVLALAKDSELIALMNKIPARFELESAVKNLVEYFLPLEVSAERQTFYADIVKSKVSAGNWSSELNAGSAKVAEALRNLIEEIILSPDFQLC